MRGRAAKAAQGKWVTAYAPFGYVWDLQAKRPVGKPEELPIVKLIFSKAAGGWSAGRIAEHLRAERIPSRKEGRWTQVQVGSILNRRCYQGEWQVAPGIPAAVLPEPAAIVDKATWKRAQGQRKRNRKHVRNSSYRFLLSGGLVKCGVCGKAMVGKQSQDGYDYYVCWRRQAEQSCEAKSIPARALEAEVWRLAEELIGNPAAARAYLQETEEQFLPAWQEDLARHERAVEDCERKLERAQIAYENGDYGLEELRRSKERILGDKAAWAERIGELQGRIGRQELREEAIGRVGQIAEEWRGSLPSLTMQERHDLVNQLGFKLAVSCEDWGAKLKDRRFRVRIEWLGESWRRVSESLQEADPSLRSG